MNDLDRYDIELLAQTQIPDSNFGWIMGGRWEHDGVKSRNFTTNVASQDLPNIGVKAGQVFPGFSSINVDFDTITGKLGATAVAPINEAGTLRFFGNAMLSGGVRILDLTPGRSFTYGVIGPDISGGIQYALSSNMVADLRYRANIFFDLGGPTGSQREVIDHGPMASLNIKF